MFQNNKINPAPLVNKGESTMHAKKRNSFPATDKSDIDPSYQQDVYGESNTVSMILNEDTNRIIQQNSLSNSDGSSEGRNSNSGRNYDSDNVNPQSHNGKTGAQRSIQMTDVSPYPDEFLQVTSINKNDANNVSQPNHEGTYSKDGINANRSDDRTNASTFTFDTKKVNDSPGKEDGQLNSLRKSQPDAGTPDPSDNVGEKEDENQIPDDYDEYEDDIYDPSGRAGYNTPVSKSSDWKETKVPPVKTRDDFKNALRAAHTATNERLSKDLHKSQTSSRKGGKNTHRHFRPGNERNHLRQKRETSTEGKSQGDGTRPGAKSREWKISHPIDKFSKMEGSQYGYTDLVKALETMDRNAVYYYIYLFLHQRDVSVQKLLLYFRLLNLCIHFL